MTYQTFNFPNLSPRAHRASIEYGNAFNAAKRSNYARRKAAIGTLRNCRELLSPTEIAILDMVAGRRASIIGVARYTSRPVEELWALYEGACEMLAIAFGYSNHFPQSENPRAGLGPADRRV